MNESEMIELARRGDLDAFNLLVLSYQDRVFGQAYRMLGESQAAEDIAQDTFLLAYRKLGSFHGGSFKAWLMRIATNLCLDQLRREKRRTFISLEPYNSDGEEIESPAWLADPGESPEDSTERAELADLIQRCINYLSPKYRAAVTLVDVEGMDYEEAASALSVSLGTLKSRLSRGRVQMLEAWQDLNSSTPLDRLSKKTGSQNAHSRLARAGKTQTLAVLGYT